MLDTPIRLTKWFKIHGSHKISGIYGPCSTTHGHEWRIGITVDGPLNTSLFTIADTDLIKTCFWSLFESDHIDWNARLGCDNASTEAIAIFIRGQLGVGPLSSILCGVTVEESDGLTVEIVVR